MANFGGSWMSEFERIAVEKGWNISKEARFKGPLAKKIQRGINLIAQNFKGYDPSIASVTIKEDGDFGPDSMAAFDKIRQAVMNPEFMKLYGHNRAYHALRSKLHAPEGSAAVWDDGLTDLAEMFMEGNPAQRFVQKHKEMAEGIKERVPGQKPAPKTEKPFVKDTMPPLQEVEVGGEVKEHTFGKKPAPKAKKPFVEDTMPPLQEVEVGGEVKEHTFDTKRSSQVLQHLVKLANDLDEMGSADAAIVVDEHLRNYKEASDKLYDVFGETGEDLINMAHPGGGPTIVPASDEGGKVETVVEEHKKLVDKVNKAPTGKIASKKAYVEAIQKLVKKANALEESGQVEAAQAVDRAIGDLQDAVLPFVNRSSAIEAAGSEDSKASVKLAEGDWRSIWATFAKSVETVSSSLEDASVLFSGMHPNIKMVKQFYPSLRKLVSKIHKSVSSGKLNLSGIQKYIPTIDAKLSVIDDVALNAIKGLWGSPNKRTRSGLKAMKASAAHKGVMSNFEQLKQLASSAGDQTISKELKKYHGTINSLKKFISDNRDFVRFFLGSPKLPTDARRVEGSNQLKKLYVWLNKELKKSHGDEDADMSNINLWNKIYQPLKKGLERKNQPVAQRPVVQESKKEEFSVPDQPQSAASKEEPLVKTAIPFSVNPGGGTSDSGGAGVRRTRRPGGARRRRKGDPNVKDLQQAMVGAGIDLRGVGKRDPVDGQWGSRTWTAYGKLQELAQTIDPSIQLPMAGPKTPPTDFSEPLRIARYLASKQTATVSGQIEIAEGKTITGSSLRSVGQFVAALSRANIIDSKAEGKDQRNRELASQAFQVLKDFYDRFKSNGMFQDRLKIRKDFKLISRQAQMLYSQLMKFRLPQKQQQGQAPRAEGDLLNPFADKKAPAQSGSAKIHFSPNDLGSIKSAIRNLREDDVSSYRAFRDNVLGDYNADVKVGYKNYYPQVISLMNALQKHQQIISRQESPDAFRTLYDKLNMYMTTLNTNVGSHFRR